MFAVDFDLNIYGTEPRLMGIEVNSVDGVRELHSMSDRANAPSRGDEEMIERCCERVLKFIKRGICPM